MTKQEPQQRKTELEAELKTVQEIIDTKPTPGERFMELIKGFAMLPKHKDFQNVIFFEKDGSIIAEYNMGSRHLWIKFEGYWQVLEDEYKLSYDKTQAVIKAQVEQAYGLKGVTTEPSSRWPKWLVEQAYGLNEAAP